MPLISYDEFILSPGEIPDNYESVGLFYTSDTTDFLGIGTATNDIVKATLKEAKKEGLHAIFNYRIEVASQKSSIVCVAYGTAAKIKE
ncbi:hypothetical protein [Azospirillum argentinense]